jgi:hypothetical protein
MRRKLVQALGLMLCAGCGAIGGEPQGADGVVGQAPFGLASSTPILTSVAFSATGTLTLSGSNLGAVTRAGFFGGPLGSVAQIGVFRSQFNGTATTPIPLAVAPARSAATLEVGAFPSGSIRFADATKYAFVVGTAKAWSAPLAVTFTFPSQAAQSGTVAVQACPNPGVAEWNGHHWKWMNHRQSNVSYTAGGLNRVLSPLVPILRRPNQP